MRRLTALVIAVVLGACGNPAPSSGGDRTVVLGEEFLLADVMALGVRPVAATATIDDRFRGIDHDTDGIRVLNTFELSPEQLVALRPTRIITTSFIEEQAGADRLRAIAPTVVLADHADWRDAFDELAEKLDAKARAAALIERYDDAIREASAGVEDGLTASMASIYPGENIGVWVSGPVNIPATFIDAGVELVPGAGAYEDVSNGRAYISTERLTDLRGDVVVLLQSSDVGGEDAALSSVRSTGLWRTLPAVKAGRVVVLDRLGYPGIEGRTRLASELVSRLEEVG